MGDEKSVQTLNYWNGLIMLVSVGTLLYITTMHMLPEVYGSSHTHEHAIQAPETLKSEDKEEPETSRGVKLATLILGINAAFLLTSIH